MATTDRDLARLRDEVVCLCTMVERLATELGLRGRLDLESPTMRQFWGDLKAAKGRAWRVGRTDPTEADDFVGE